MGQQADVRSDSRHCVAATSVTQRTADDPTNQTSNNCADRTEHRAKASAELCARRAYSPSSTPAASHPQTLSGEVRVIASLLADLVLIDQQPSVYHSPVHHARGAEVSAAAARCGAA